MTDAQPRECNAPVPLPTARSHPFDPPPELGRFREQQPLRRLIYPNGDIGWLVTSYRLARTVLGDSRFSARLEFQQLPVSAPALNDVFYGHPAPPGIFIYMDAPDHTRYRRLLTGHFTARRLKELRPRIEQIVQNQLDAMEQAGPPADLWQAFRQVPFLTICELLGVPDTRRAELRRHHSTLLSMEASTEEGAAAWQAIMDYFRELIVHKRAQSGDDLLSSLAASGELNDEELTGVGGALLGGGIETAASMLALGTFALLCHPDQLELLRSDPSSIDNAIEELLRYLTIFQIGPGRTPLEDVELEGQLIKAGECITISLPAANRDPQKFDDPDKLNLTRAASGHLAFGYGVHQCIGQQLARIEMRIGYLALLQRFPGLRLAVPPEEIPLRVNMLTYGVHRLPVAW